MRALRREQDTGPRGIAQAPGQAPGRTGAKQGRDRPCSQPRAELIDVYNVRAELEGYACELASANVSTELLHDLDAATVLVTEAVSYTSETGLTGEGQVSLDIQLGRANSDFHGAIAVVGGNARLRSLMVELQDFFPKDYVWRAMASADELRALNLEEHAAYPQGLRPAPLRARARRCATHPSRVADPARLPGPAPVLAVIDGPPRPRRGARGGNDGVRHRAVLRASRQHVVLTARRATTLQTSRARIDDGLRNWRRAGALNPGRPGSRGRPYPTTRDLDTP